MRETAANSKRRMTALEANFDGLVGPTHNYAGLAHGNVASQANRRTPANPRAAALQGLEKMRRLAALGLPQAVLPPQPRPDSGLAAQAGLHRQGRRRDRQGGQGGSRPVRLRL